MEYMQKFIIKYNNGVRFGCRINFQLKTDYYFQAACIFCIYIGTSQVDNYAYLVYLCIIN